MTAVKIAAGIERAIREGGLLPGERLPTVRILAGELGVNPATVASAYQALQTRALLVSQGRRGTRVTHRPLAAARLRPVITPGAVNLADGNPDPALLPNLRKVLRKLDYSPHLYGGRMMHEGLIKLMRREMERDDICVGLCCVVNGTMDGLDRLIAEHLRPGDRVAVEDPGFTGHHDLITSRGLSLAPVRIDDEGMIPDALERACSEGVQAALITPRAQSPTGATLSAQRARELRRVLQRHPEVLVMEDDHLSFLCEGELHSVHHDSPRWAHLRSFSKSFNPDLRLSVMTGDEETMTRLLDRLVVVERWVSHILQGAAHALLSDKSVRAQVREAGRTYDTRRETLLAAMEKHGLKPGMAARVLGDGSSVLRSQEDVPSTPVQPQHSARRTQHSLGTRNPGPASGLGRGSSCQTGFNVWMPVAEETPTVQALAQRGWAVAAGERFRLSSPPGIRVTASRLEPRDAARFAADAAEVLAQRIRSRA